MKYFCLTIITILFCFFLSCKGTPDNNDQFDDTAEDIYESLVPEDFTQTELDFLADDYFDDEESADITQDETDNEILNDTADADEMEAEDFEYQEELVLAQPQDEEPAAEEIPETYGEVAQALPESQVQPPVVSALPPAQTQPQQQTLPASPPALLGPAEEIYPLEREKITEESSRDFTRIETPASSQTAITPQDLQNTQSDEIIFSRVVRATVGQIIEIPFRGTGWVYLGELASRRGIAYDSRRLDNEGQSFIFRAEEAGTYALKFFRQDFIRDYILNDHVQVIVGESPDAGGAGWFNPPVDRGRVTAQPRWPSPLEEAELQRTGSISSLGAAPVDTSVQQTPSASSSVPQSASPQPSFAAQLAPDAISSQGANSAPVTTEVSSEGIASLFTPAETPPAQSSAMQTEPVENIENLPPDVLFQRAKENFDAGNVSAAIALLDQLSKYYPYGNDELYWLYGQFYEANTPAINILLSLDYYRRLTDEFPQSNYYNDARGRIAYLERFYIHIR